MKPVFLDFHIHTSDNPERLNDISEQDVRVFRRRY